MTYSHLKNRKKINVMSKIFVTVCCVFLLFSCQKDTVSTIGSIVGYVYCHEVINQKTTDNYILGIYIISNSGDSLLSFNVPKSIHALNDSDLQIGDHYLEKKNNIRFTYRNSTKSEIKSYECPPVTAMNIPFYSVASFTQVVVSGISVVK